MGERKKKLIGRHWVNVKHVLTRRRGYVRLRRAAVKERHSLRFIKWMQFPRVVDICLGIRTEISIFFRLIGRRGTWSQEMTSFSRFVIPTEEHFFRWTQIESHCEPGKREQRNKLLTSLMIDTCLFASDVFDGHKSNAYDASGKSTRIGSGPISISGHRDCTTDTRILPAHDRLLAENGIGSIGTTSGARAIGPTSGIHQLRALGPVGPH